VGKVRTLRISGAWTDQNPEFQGVVLFCATLILLALGTCLIAALGVGAGTVEISRLYARGGISTVEILLAAILWLGSRWSAVTRQRAVYSVYALVGLMEILLLAFVSTGVPAFVMLMLVFPLAYTGTTGFHVLQLVLVLFAQTLAFLAADKLTVYVLPSYVWYLIAAGLALSVRAYHMKFGAALAHLSEGVAELGSYRLVEKLGSGGMGEVWRAEHRMLKRPAAIKLIRKERLVGDDSNPDRERIALARFEREAQLTSRLTSSHTVRLYDFGRSDSDGVYYAMELLDGMDLERMVSQYGPLPEARVRHILMQLCDSLSEAHACGLIHRDIKPANVFLSQQGLQLDFVKLLDFGLAIEEENFESGERLTVKGKITGSPTTMAPEQAFGEQVDGRADIYALGCVAYYALTGRHVFLAANPRDMLIKHVKSIPDLPSSFVSVSPEFEALIMKCLAKSREERPQTTPEVCEMLQKMRLESEWDQTSAVTWYRSKGLPFREEV
jgi:tRNA A-37 threonylcarbamoyl transferase component Bud32